jgi:TolA-binding protein
MEIARTKLNSNLQDQAVADLRQIVRDYPQSATASDAAFLSTEVLEKMGRVEDAMAAHLEFANRFPNDARASASRLRLAELTLRSKQPNRETAALEIFGQIIRDFPKTPAALQAFQGKARIETERRLETKDPLVGKQVPAALVTLRTMTEQFPEAPATMSALNRLAQLYVDQSEYLRAAHALTDLANHFPTNPHDAWFRLGELYERRLNDKERARAAYAQVPKSSPRFKDAQRKAQQK